MGEPAIPSYDERRWIRAYARSVVEAVRNDEEQPEPRFADGDAMPDDLMIFKLAHEVELQQKHPIVALLDELRVEKGRIAPRLDKDQIPWCDSACPFLVDGKCGLLGEAPQSLCIPGVAILVEMANRLALLEHTS